MTAPHKNPHPLELPLADRILNTLSVYPFQRANELAQLLNVDAQEVAKCLAELQGISLEQDPLYRWSLTATGTAPDAIGGGGSRLRTEMSRLSQYYLDCLGQDSDTGVSVFAKGSRGSPEYAELEWHPHAGPHEPWWVEPEARRVLDEVRLDKRNLEAWVGYPVRLRKHQTANWEGYFVEPVLLWRVTFPANVGEDFTLEDGLPQINFSFLRSISMGGASAMMEEAAALGAELGLNNLPIDQPTMNELLLRLFSLRPEWDWAEALDPAACSSDVPLSNLSEAGIYNRAILVSSKRSPYTLGLESELKALSLAPSVDFLGTALDQWFHGKFQHGWTDESEGAHKPLLEVIPMNSEQRAAVQSALVAPLTVVTGPPGTGKSQMVTNLLVNAAWRGMRVLFASKNNKAVDVVEARVNDLGVRPVLLRLGSSEYQNRLSHYFSTMLSGQVGADDQISYQERLSRHTALLQQAEVLDQLQLKTLDARNHADQLDREVEEYRTLYGQARFSGINDELVRAGMQRLSQFVTALELFNPGHASLFDRLFGFLLKGSRLNSLMQALDHLAPAAQALGAGELEDFQAVGYTELREFAQVVSEKLDAARTVLSYKGALEALLISPPFEAIAQCQMDLTEQVALNSAGLWRDWVQLAPSRLTPQERNDVAEYASLLQVLSDPSAKNAGAGVRLRTLELQRKVTALFSCWAVTSLSVRGKVPLEPGYFDLVVFDEASQCDIASALPLLYRAKRAVIIGDPLQLRHISALSRSKDLELQGKRGLAQSRGAWLYSVNSLYDLAAGVAAPGAVINLRDHHRSHRDIIEFSNKHFYGGRLRVATRYSSLSRPDEQSPGVLWTHVTGSSVRPVDGGLRNPVEAEQVVAALKALLLGQKFKGTVGIVTPFRAQATLIQQLLRGHQDMAEAMARCELLVDTVHRFQGDERDVILFSPVISIDASASAIAFLRNNANLFNVAITRARGLLHVIGDAQAAKACDVAYLCSFVQYVWSLQDGRGATAPKPGDLGARYPVVPRLTPVSEWEKAFYEALYAAGLRPVPQLAVEQHALDFALESQGRLLNIEVDAEGYHRGWTGETCMRDQLRSQRLIELGWTVKRFWVYELKDRMQDCVEQVLEWARSPR